MKAITIRGFGSSWPMPAARAVFCNSLPKKTVTETAGRTAATWRARIRPAPIVPLFRCIHGRMTLRWAETFHHANPAISGLVWTFRRCDPEKGLCVRREAPSSRNTFWAKILKMRGNINSHNEDYGTRQRALASRARGAGLSLTCSVRRSSRHHLRGSASMPFPRRHGPRRRGQCVSVDRSARHVTRR